MTPIYLDHAATAPLDPYVLEAMMPYLTSRYGNASSLHAAGRMARHAVEEARLRIAHACRVPAESVIFTSGGTEADNMAVIGVASMRPGPVVSSPTEHEAVLRPLSRMAETGRPVHWLSVRPDASVQTESVASFVNPSIALVTVMHVNNETGAVNDTQAIGAVCRHAGVPFHTDAVQSTAWFSVAPDDLGADLVTLSAHKIGGPKGVGALIVRPGIALSPLILGGNQERRRRGGTENVAAIVGFGAAIESSRSRREADALRVAALRDDLRSRLESEAGSSARWITPDRAAPHLLYGFVGDAAQRTVDAEMLLLRLDLEGVQASSGSACTSGTLEAGHIPRAIGASGAPLRLSLGRETTQREIERASGIIARVIAAVSV